MTIVCYVKVNDGVVLGSDSVISLYTTDAEGKVGVFQTYENANKLGQIGDLPVGYITWGLGNIGQVSVDYLIQEFGRHLCLRPAQPPFDPQAWTIEQLGQLLLSHLERLYMSQYEKIAPEKRPGLSVLLAGYSPGKTFADDCEVTFPGRTLRRGRPDNPDGTPNFGAFWAGAPLPWTRIHFGIDSRLLDDLVGEQKVTPQEAQELRNRYQSPVAFGGMPLQEAADYAKLVIETTVKFLRFEPGPNICGGPIDLAIVRPPPYGFQWVRQKMIVV